MGQKVTIGGDRLGSGNQMKTELNNYGRSTHNLSQKWASSMAPGILYPFMVIPALRGDKFEIDLEAAARTIPTKGPLFGSYKMQMDVFQCPVRLYQALLHNNPTDIGLKMKDIYLPTVTIETNRTLGKKGAFSNSCLMKYLGVSGLGCSTSAVPNDTITQRTFNAVPMLAYYDIFKNYYSNKQEEYAYVITPKTSISDNYVPYWISGGGTTQQLPFYNAIDYTGTYLLMFKPTYTMTIDQSEYNLLMKGLTIILYKGFKAGSHSIVWQGTLLEYEDKVGSGSKLHLSADFDNDGHSVIIHTQTGANSLDFKNTFGEYIDSYELIATSTKELALEPFKLKNIDDMRMEILSFHEMGEPFKVEENEVGQEDGYPYYANYGYDEDGKTWNEYSHNGLVIKTYQSDLFNNWVNTDWIDGENGIAEITKIAVQDGAFKIDALNLAEKLYNMLNRVAVSGGTYEDWQTAVYMESPRRHIESPIYLGGMSNEVVFEEIISSASTENQPLGSLGGRGVLIKRKGGNINVKVDEASYIIGIVSLTPRIYQTQGNEWYMTEIQTLDDMHKPALDGIGFQNLMAERMAWFGTRVVRNSLGKRSLERQVVGKVPAWIEYMTAVDKAYGDFADVNGKGFMILNRNYEIDDDAKWGIKDATTYIDPTKYNYAFAYTELDAQNFWVQINTKIIARRLMSAKQIPNI